MAERTVSSSQAPQREHRRDVVWTVGSSGLERVSVTSLCTLSGFVSLHGASPLGQGVWGEVGVGALPRTLDREVRLGEQRKRSFLLRFLQFAWKWEDWKIQHRVDCSGSHI